MPETTLNSLNERLMKVELEMAQFRVSLAQVDEIHSAFFKPTRPTKPALIDRIYTIADAADNSKFAYSFAIKAVLTIGAVAGAIAATVKLWVGGAS